MTLSTNSGAVEYEFSVTVLSGTRSCKAFAALAVSQSYEPATQPNGKYLYIPVTLDWSMSIEQMTDLHAALGTALAKFNGTQADFT